MSHKARVLFPFCGIAIMGLALYYLFAPTAENQMPVMSSVIVTEEATPLAEWRQYTPQSGVFKVFLPQLPQHATEHVPLSEGGDGSIIYEMYLAQAKPGSTFLINVIEYPSVLYVTDENALLDGIVKEMMAGNSASKLESQTKAEFLHHPAVDFQVNSPSGTVFAKAILAKNRVFILSVIDDNVERGRQSFQNFINTFTLVESDTQAK